MQHQSVIELLRMWQSHLPTGARPDNSNPVGQRWWGEVEAACAVLGASQAALDVFSERRRQIEDEGRTPEHDDNHGEGSMAFAAAAYAVHADAGPRLSTVIWNWTGWCRDWWKPKNKRQNLVRAAALLIAEVERMDRAKP